MELIELTIRQGVENEKKLSNYFNNFGKLIVELKKKSIPDEIVMMINKEIETINDFSGSDKELLKLLRTTLSKIITLIEKELKIVAKNYYRSLWLSLGMAAFGVPMGVAIGASSGNMAFLGIGIPIGMLIGLAIGSRMDKKALDEGRQLDLELLA